MTVNVIASLLHVVLQTGLGFGADFADWALGAVAEVGCAGTAAQSRAPSVEGDGGFDLQQRAVDLSPPHT